MFHPRPFKENLMSTSRSPLDLAVYLGLPTGPLLAEERFVKSPSPQARVMHLPDPRSHAPRALCKSKSVMVEYSASLANRLPVCVSCNKRENGHWPNRDREAYWTLLDELAKHKDLVAETRQRCSAGAVNLELLARVENLSAQFDNIYACDHWRRVCSVDPEAPEALESLLEDLRRDLGGILPSLRDLVRQRSLDKVSLRCAVRLVAGDISDAARLRRYRRERHEIVESVPEQLDFVELPDSVTREALNLLETWADLRSFTAAPVFAQQLLEKAGENHRSAGKLRLEHLNEVPTEFLVHDPATFSNPLEWARAEWKSAWERCAAQIVDHAERLLQEHLRGADEVAILDRSAHRVSDSDARKVAVLVASSDKAVALRTSRACARYLVKIAERDAYGETLPGDTPDEVLALVVSLVEKSWSGPQVSAADALRIATALSI
jgi:hypothetical protein